MLELVEGWEIVLEDVDAILRGQATSPSSSAGNIG